MKLPLIEPDRLVHNADWTKRRWDLPPYRSKAFMRHLKAMRMSLEQFRRLPVYQFAVQQGLIKGDKWMGRSGRRRS